MREKNTFYSHRTLSMSGSFSNYIIKKKKFERQIHPYSSTSAIGYNAKIICQNNTNHVYGKDSPFEKLINLNAKFLSIGLPINLNCSQVHHAELEMKVPYRYNKKFIHPIKIKNIIKNKEFFMFVVKKKISKN